MFQRSTAKSAACTAIIASRAQSELLCRIRCPLKLLILRRAHPVVGTGALAAKGVELSGGDGICVRRALLQIHKLAQGRCVYKLGCLPPAISPLHVSQLPCGR